MLVTRIQTFRLQLCYIEFQSPKFQHLQWALFCSLHSKRASTHTDGQTWRFMYIDEYDEYAIIKTIIILVISKIQLGEPLINFIFNRYQSFLMMFWFYVIGCMDLCKYSYISALTCFQLQNLKQERTPTTTMRQFDLLISDFRCLSPTSVLTTASVNN